MRLAFVLAATLPLVALAQQPERFDFNGIPLGITQAQFVERFPLTLCEKGNNPVFSDTMCIGFREYACCLPVANCKEQLARDYSYAGAELQSVYAFFYSDSLARIILRFKSRDFETVFRALV